MFADLPEPLQEKVREYLIENNFPAAKTLYDEYHRQQSCQQQPSTSEDASQMASHLEPREISANRY